MFPIVTVIVLVLVNMLLIKRFVGSKLLSNGTTIRHRGECMQRTAAALCCHIALPQ